MRKVQHRAPNIPGHTHILLCPSPENHCLWLNRDCCFVLSSHYVALLSQAFLCNSVNNRLIWCSLKVKRTLFHTGNQFYMNYNSTIDRHTGVVNWAQKWCNTNLTSFSSWVVCDLDFLSSSSSRNTSTCSLTVRSLSLLNSSHCLLILSLSCTILSRSLNAQSRRFLLKLASSLASKGKVFEPIKCHDQAWSINGQKVGLPQKPMATKDPFNHSRPHGHQSDGWFDRTDPPVESRLTASILKFTMR